MSQWLKTDVRKILSRSSGLPLLAKSNAQPVARSLCHTWAICFLSYWLYYQLCHEIWVFQLA